MISPSSVVDHPTKVYPVLGTAVNSNVISAEGPSEVFIFRLFISVSPLTLPAPSGEISVLTRA